ncbi:STAS domain-containing protein [Domibacillus sp. A3M-37]|uniref:STAS domain-containing protein n=1 Tax=Domibacillus sp. A3M-37 TaxID=2962037 RepID=UPI0020B7B888|nr:STAS domain-containing protein [Domibacillus sp. A3M-37]MCP3763870.1 STAS domain-containing protein [Domibacillus sp. A3M-37]
MSLYLNDHYVDDISNKILSLRDQLINEKANLDSNPVYANIEKYLKSWRENLVEIYAYSISRDMDVTFSILREWGNEAVDTLVNLNMPLDIALDEVRDYRNLIGLIIKDEAVKYDLSFDQFYEILSRFDAVVDRAVHWLSISYTRKFLTRINAAEAVALELSIPVIKVNETVGVLPLIGDIDTKRAQELMDKALTKSSELSLEYIVIDLSGVPIIDTMVADRIFKVINGLSLLGVKTLLAGIRPEIAQTMINLGVNVNTSDIRVYSSLQKALKSLRVESL